VFFRSARVGASEIHPEERIRVLTGAMFGRVVLIVRRADGNLTWCPQLVGEWSGVDCGLYGSPETAEAESSGNSR
jgi:hypothetical protein